MNKKLFADLLLVGVSFTWGATFVLIKAAINILPPFSFLSFRFLIAGFLLALFLLFFHHKTLRLLSNKIWFPGFLLGFWLFIGFTFQTFGLKYTTASKAGFLTGFSVVIVPFFSLWLLGNSLKRNAVFGILIAMFGLAMLSGNGNFFGVNIGDVLVGLAAIAYGLQITLVSRYSPHFSALILSWIQIMSCGILSLTFAVIFEKTQLLSSPSTLLNQSVFSALIVSSLIGTAFAFVAQNNFQKFTTPTHTALIFASEPVFAALISYLWAGEHFTIVQGIGCLLILCGMLISEL